ncbi:MAG: protein veg [Tissierellia bacterium]|nr:protein veg [Tissierellia bacterium]
MGVLDNLKRFLGENLGKRVIVKADRGRKRVVTKRGTLDAVYPSLFVVEMAGSGDNNRKITFTYSDLLTSTVELTILDDELEAQPVY